MVYIFRESGRQEFLAAVKDFLSLFRLPPAPAPPPRSAVRDADDEPCTILPRLSPRARS